MQISAKQSLMISTDTALVGQLCPYPYKDI